MKAQDRFIKDWLTMIRLRKIALPRFQRFEAWGPSIINDFWTSIVRGLPVGVSLILEVGHDIPFKYRYLSGAPESGENLRELLLDGQQRLTALWRALTDDYDDRTYLLGVDTSDDADFDLLGLDLDLHNDRLYVEGWGRWTREGKKFPLWIDDPVRCFKKGKIPLKILNPDDSRYYQEWCKIAAEDNPQTQIKLITIVTAIRNRIENFNIPYLFLPAETEKAVAIDVFIKLNTSYAPLTVFDIIVAQVEEEIGESLHDLLNNLRGEVPEIDDYMKPDRYVLSVAALMQDKIPNEKGFLALDLGQAISDWPKIIKATRELVELFEADCIFDNERLPTETILAPLAALFADAPSDPDKKGNLRILLRKYMWRAFFTERYDRSVATRILPDFRQLKRVIDGEAKEDQVPIFDENQFPLPSKEVLIQAGWPKKRDRLARAILNLSLQKGAIDFADASKISRKNIISREYHHLYPEALLKEKNLSDKDIYRALNCALISWKTNRKITRKEPIRYLLERAQTTNLGEEEIRRRLASHFVNYDVMKDGDYVNFLQDRAEIIHNLVKEVCMSK